MSKKKPNPVEVQFRDEYPTGRVAEHEVFMSFNGDSEALDFQEWWDDEGKAVFETWREKYK